MVWLYLMGCTEYEYTSKLKKDVFQQSRKNTVDILLVVDDSCSMIEEQSKLSTNFDSFISVFQQADVDWQIGVVTTDTYYNEVPGTLIGGDDEVILASAEGAALDSVKWNRSWGFEAGVALQLDPNKYSPTSNTSKSNWCPSIETFGDGELGTPKMLNHTCDGSELTESPIEDGEPNTEIQTPSVGDIIITEIFADPIGVSDKVGEWIEITNVTQNTFDLSNYQLRDDGGNLFIFPEGTLIEPAAIMTIGRSQDTSINGGVDIDILSQNFTLMNNQVFLTQTEDDADETFAEMVVVGTSGSGIEMGMEAAHLALSEPLMSTSNFGFIREDANLSVIFLSDEDDFSPRSTNEYLELYTEVKGDAAYRDHSKMRVSAVIGKDKPPFSGEPACQSDDGFASYGARFVQMVQRTEGVLESICDDDFSPIAEELGLTASGLEVEFVLSSKPDLETLIVKNYAEESDDSFIRELIKDEDFRYVTAKNSIVFEVTALPSSESYIVAEYRVLPDTVTVVDSGLSTDETEENDSEEPIEE